jgi:hypothetical protein
LEIALEDKEKQLKKIDLLIEEKMRNKREEYEILYNSAK